MDQTRKEMQKCFEELLSVNIAEFVSGIRREIGETLKGEKWTENLTHSIWYVWSPVGTGNTKDGKTRDYYGERAGCTMCSSFTWDLATCAPCADISTRCSSCATKICLAEIDFRKTHNVR